MDRNRAVEIFLIAAENDLSVAQYSLATCYESGIGIPKNMREAARWYQLAADNNYPQAQARMGYLCTKGVGVVLDYEQAYFWYLLATANEEDVTSQRDQVSGQLSSDQRQCIQKQAKQWLDEYFKRESEY